jgi:hypothetical protein
VEADLAQVSHGFVPQLFEPFCEAAGQIAVTDEQGREPAVRDKGMVEGQDDGFFVDDMKGVAELSGIAHSGEVSNLGPMAPKKFDEERRALIREPKDDTVINLLLGGVPRDAAQQGQS